MGVVFGKDRAHGGNAEGPAEAAAAMEAELETQLNDLQVNESIGANVDEIEAKYKANCQVNNLNILLFSLTVIFLFFIVAVFMRKMTLLYLLYF